MQSGMLPSTRYYCKVFWHWERQDEPGDFNRQLSVHAGCFMHEHAGSVISKMYNISVATPEHVCVCILKRKYMLIYADV